MKGIMSGWLSKISGVRYWWRDLSVARKLYTVFGIMAFLIGFELLVLSFTMNTLSSVRAFVEGEGYWSKSQKDAVNSLYKYIITGDDRYYHKYKNYLQIPMGDRQGLIEVEKPNPDEQNLFEGFIKGNNHPDDIEGMVSLLRNFNQISYLNNAIVAWKAANVELDKFTQMAEEIHQKIKKKNLTEAEIKDAVTRLDLINDDLTILENRFSYSLSEGSRWLEGWLLFLIVLLVLTVEITGLTFTLTFSHHLSKMLTKMTGASKRIGEGDFDQRVEIESKDELGQLAASINNMAKQLKSNVHQRKEAEHTSKVKSLFLANMSHEIRTPLSSIMGFAELLQNKDLPDKEKDRYLNIIQSAGENLTNVINDILDISKVESGHLSIELVPFSLLKLLNDLKGLLRFKCEEKGIYLSFIIDDKIPNFIKTDPVRLRQILLNLLSNAIKFTEKGEVKLIAYERNGFLFFDIYDSGVGVPFRDRDLIFEQFRQSDSEHSRKHGGTGLGLPLSKHLARLLGGDLHLINSEPGKGSHFQTFVGYQKTTKEQSERVSTKSSESKLNLSGTKLLVVDDSEDIRVLLKEILSYWGCEVDFAEDGYIALEKIKKNQYDMVLSDIQMPGMSGFELVQKLREDSAFQIPVIAQTAHAMKEDRERCLEAGFDAVVTKPIKTEELVRVLSEYRN